jgi:phage gp16-like protein
MNKYPARFEMRRKELAQIHMMAEQIGMDTADKNEDSAYRAMLWTVARVRSSAALDFAGRNKVIDFLKTRGAKSGFAGKPANVRPELVPLMSKIGALLADMKLPWKYAAAIAKKQTSAQGKGIDRLEWLNAQQLHAVVTALVKRQAKLQTPSNSPLSGGEPNSSPDKGRPGGV